LPRAQPSNARKPDGKLIGLHRIKLLKPRPSLIHINRYRYKRLYIVHDLNPRALSPKLSGFVQAQSWFLDLTPIVVSP
jgi:hypothetical protein